jgi:hypothetical protein
MKFLEKDLEQIIFESGRDSLENRGLSINGKLFRQLKIGNYGIADLVEFTRPIYDGPKRKFLVPGTITVYELKKENIGIASFLQALHYVKGIQTYIESKNKSKYYIFNIVLIGRSIDLSGSFCFITDMLSINNRYYDGAYMENGTINFITYDYNINGLFFKSRSGYNLSNEGF